MTISGANGSDNPRSDRAIVRTEWGAAGDILVKLALGVVDCALDPARTVTGRTPHHFGIDQGPVVLMIENYRSGLIWDIMRRCPAVIAGLRRAGFTGGWL